MSALSEFKKLANLPDSADRKEKQRRGRSFEKVVKNFLTEENLSPSASYKPTGEEIDGSFELDNKTYLLEMKWHGNPLPASQVYTFKGKVDGKLVGTVGVFISVSGYTKNAVDAIRFGKELNIILFDRNDFELALSDGCSFEEVLRYKLRAAAKEGAIYVPYIKEVKTHRAVLNVICEGPIDRTIIHGLTNRILTRDKLSLEFNIVSSSGVDNLAKIANHYSEMENTKMIIVADSEYRQSAIRERIEAALSFQPEAIILPEPSIETWIWDPSVTNMVEFIRAIYHDSDHFLDSIKKVDLDQLMNHHDSFREYYEQIRKVAV